MDERHQPVLRARTSNEPDSHPGVWDGANQRFWSRRQHQLYRYECYRSQPVLLSGASGALISAVRSEPLPWSGVAEQGERCEAPEWQLTQRVHVGVQVLDASPGFRFLEPVSGFQRAVETMDLPTLCRLQIGDTADCKSALPRGPTSRIGCHARELLREKSLGREPRNEKEHPGGPDALAYKRAESRRVA